MYSLYISLIIARDVRNLRKYLLVLLSITILSSSSISVSGLSENTAVVDNGFNYTVIDVYSDGTEIVRGIKHTSDNTMLGRPSFDQSSHPLSSDALAMLGGDEIMLTFFFEELITNTCWTFSK